MKALFTPIRKAWAERYRLATLARNRTSDASVALSSIDKRPLAMATSPRENAKPEENRTHREAHTNRRTKASAAARTAHQPSLKSRFAARLETSLRDRSPFARGFAHHGRALDALSPLRKPAIDESITSNRLSYTRGHAR